MERARTEWLRALGFEQDQLVQTLGIIFVVGHIDISYRKPARFNDELFINTSIHKLGKASIEFHQNITRTAKDQQRELLTTASVKVICVNMATFRSASIPTVIRELLQ
jgi:acyl-CoA thioester hydrolase